MNIDNRYVEIYLRQKSKLVRKRRKALDLMEDKLLHMRKLAAYVRDYNPTPGECECAAIDETFQILKDEVEELDEYSRRYNTNKIDSNVSRSIKRLEEKINQ